MRTNVYRPRVRQGRGVGAARNFHSEDEALRIQADGARGAVAFRDGGDLGGYETYGIGEQRDVSTCRDVNGTAGSVCTGLGPNHRVLGEQRARSDIDVGTSAAPLRNQ